ncbi:MAG: hypothetical protein ABI266_00140 [Ginsengibacter sp.]
MQTNLKSIITAALFTTLFMNNSIAQNVNAISSNDMVLAKNENVSVNTSKVYRTTTSNITDPINVRVANKFSELFPEAQNEQWAVDGKGYWVSFTNEGQKLRAGFTNNGLLNYTIKDCNRDQLSAKLNNYIAKNYVGYHLLNGIEINTNGEKTQQAIIENESGYVTLKSAKDAIQVMQKMQKAN